MAMASDKSTAIRLEKSRFARPVLAGKARQVTWEIQPLA